MTSCATYHRNEDQAASQKPGYSDSGFALSQQKAPPTDIQSIRLYPEGNPLEPPVLNLDSGQQMILSFDYLGEQSRQFRLEISHRSQDWEQSPITPSTYLESFSRAYIQDSQPSFGKRPSYHHVEYAFPNNEIRPVVSGNYLLEIYDYDSGNLLFSVPFLIAENKGMLRTEVERLFAQREDGRPLDQLFGTYQYPEFVEYPQFDLSMSFVQNRFWGKMRKAGFLDTITPGELNGRLEREQAYIGNYEFKALDLRSFDADGEEIIEYRPGLTPPAVILRRDIQHLDTNPRRFPVSTFGLPVDDRSSNYARVEFSLETDSTVALDSDIYIVGDFNNWIISDLNKMTFNSGERLWKGHALIKQGEYAYKYVLASNNRIRDLALDQSFLSAEQEYLTLVYFRDPDRNYDRLLKVDRIIER